ncbi:MAG: N-acetyltransferase [Candidatus Melainabacteria bacterium]|nr:N-acetyltransferase [Candidatus Melainabacteria bacterium]
MQDSKERIRLATSNDAQSVLDIYAPYCLKSPATFEIQPPDVGEIRNRIDKTLTRFPYLIFEENQDPVAFAYAGQYMERAAYRFSAAVSVYVKEGFHGTGKGKALYGVLIPLLKKQGFCNAFAGITMPNPGSEALHKALGFVQTGLYKNVGYKFEKWHDVSWWQLPLSPMLETPDEPTPIYQMLEDAEYSFLKPKG